MKVKLGDVCERGSSNLKQSDVVGMSGDYPIYGAAGYLGNVDFYHQEKPYVAVVKDGAGIGRTTLHPAKSSVIGTMQYLLPKSNILPEYLYYVVSYKHLEKYFTGATIPHIYFKDYKNEKFNLDSLDMQKKIVDILSKCEGIIKSRNKELELLDELVKARFVEMFGDEKNELIRLGDVCIKITDGTHKTPKYLDRGITFISAKNIVNGELNFSDVKYISEDEYMEIQKRCQTELNDILLSKSGSLGEPVIVKSEERLGLFESLAIIKYDRNKLLPEFLCEQLKTEKIQRQFRTGTKGVAVKHLHLGVIADIGIIVPPIELQNQFADFVKRIDKSKVNYYYKNRKDGFPPLLFIYSVTTIINLSDY